MKKGSSHQSQQERLPSTGDDETSKQHQCQRPETYCFYRVPGGGEGSAEFRSIRGWVETPSWSWPKSTNQGRKPSRTREEGDENRILKKSQDSSITFIHRLIDEREANALKVGRRHCGGDKSRSLRAHVDCQLPFGTTKQITLVFRLIKKRIEYILF